MKYSVVFCLILSTLLFGCKKNELGGKSIVKGTVSHHEKIIPYATVFIKFDAKDFPGMDTTLYDSKVQADVNGLFSFKCYKGNYFLFGRGKDNANNPPLVQGGIPVSIRNNEELEITLAVTED